MKLKAPVATLVTITVGILVLLGYLVTSPAINNLQVILLGWAVVLAGMATLIGITNLITVHFKKFTAKRKRDYYSPILILSFFITLLVGLWQGPYTPTFQHVVTSIQAPVETSMMAMLAITLSFVALQLLRRKKSLMAIIFLVSVVLFLLHYSGFLTSGNSTGAMVFGAILNRLPLAGSRGILIGIALGSLTAGLRILMGSDKPYGG